MSPLNISETIALFTEVSVALTGFAGVASAFVSRDRELTPLDRVRMHSVIALSSSVLAGCLAFITAEFAELPVSASVRWAGIAGFTASLLFLVVYFPRGRRAEVDRDIAFRKSVALLSAAVLVLTIVLYACVVASPNQQVWLAAAFSLQLLHCIWMFVRLLGRPT